MSIAPEVSFFLGHIKNMIQNAEGLKPSAFYYGKEENRINFLPLN